MEDWDSTLERLRRSFLERMPDLLNDAGTALDLVVHNQQSPTSLPDLLHAFHKIAGSASTYGFHDVARAATAGETRCRTLVDSSRVATEDDIALWKSEIDAMCADVATSRARAVQNDRDSTSTEARPLDTMS